MGTTCRMLRSVILSSVTDQSWIIFITVIINAPSTFIAAGGKSFISKMVHQGERGRAFMVLASGEVLADVLGTVIFTNFYSATLNIYPSPPFLLAAGVYFTVLVILLLSAKSIKASTIHCEEKETKSTVSSGTNGSPSCMTITQKDESNDTSPILRKNNKGEGTYGICDNFPPATVSLSKVQPEDKLKAPYNPQSTKNKPQDSE